MNRKFLSTHTKQANAKKYGLSQEGFTYKNNNSEFIMAKYQSILREKKKLNTLGIEPFILPS